MEGRRWVDERGSCADRPGREFTGTMTFEMSSGREIGPRAGDEDDGRNGLFARRGGEDPIAGAGLRTPALEGAGLGVLALEGTGEETLEPFLRRGTS